MIRLTNNVTLRQARAIILEGEKVAVEAGAMKKIEDCHSFLKNFEKDKIIYGINTGFGVRQP